MRCFIVSLTWQPHTQPLLCFPSSIWQAPVLETPATSLDSMQVPILARVLQEESFQGQLAAKSSRQVIRDDDHILLLLCRCPSLQL